MALLRTKNKVTYHGRIKKIPVAGGGVGGPDNFLVINVFHRGPIRTSLEKQLDQLVAL